jgi:ribosomal protein S12 methylthiotransferase accessory factor
MIERPAFKPYFHVEAVPGEGAFLLSELGHFVLTGHLNDLVVPLIDGRRSADDIADALTQQAKMEEVFFALASLENQGHLVESDTNTPAERAAFWTALGLDSREAMRRLEQASVKVTDLRGDGAEVNGALHRNGLHCGDEGAFHLVITDDYQEPALREINALHLASRKPWMLVKPRGLVVWVGPIFLPGETGCWECLAQRLRGNREVESFIERKGGNAPFPVAKSAISASFECAIQMAALQAAVFIASEGRASALRGRLVTSNPARLITEEHVLIRRPQCPACGDSGEAHNGAMASPGNGLTSAYLQDGGLRSTPPEETYERFRHLVSPITGVVSLLTPVPNLNGGPLRIWVAGHNFALKNDSLYFLKEGLRSNSSGKGVTDAQARTSALCEAIERYSGVYRGEEMTIRASYRELGAEAIHPHACMMFSEKQYENRLEWLARGSRFQVVPLPFREDAEVEWTPVQSLTLGVQKYLPTGYLYYGYPLRDEEFFYWADSNGNAAGNTLEEAMLQGFLELVERDAVCIWWYNRVRRPGVDLRSLNDGYLNSLEGFYRSRGREFWVLDLTTDTGIPAFAAISRRVDSAVEDIVMGFGAHLDARVGMMRAVTEMNQFMPAVLNRKPDEEGGYGFDDRDVVMWWRTATLANQPYLEPAGPAHVSRLDNYQKLSAGSAGQDVATCVGIAARLGIETLVLNQTRADVGLCVAKVIAPGLRHFWARLAPGRLYDVPVRMGWLAHPLPEPYLNPIPMFV